MPPHRRDRSVDRGRINTVSIVENEAVEGLGRDDRAKLLDRPCRRGMLRHIPMEDPTRADLEDYEDIEDGLGKYAKENKLDLLIVVPREHGLVGGIFHSSHSKKLVLHTHVPVMAIHE